MNKATLQKLVGQRIRKIRQDNNISQQELALSIGKMRQVVQRIESGQVNPAIYTLREIAGGLEIKLEELLQHL